MQNSRTYANLLFDVQRSPLLYGRDECDDYVKNVKTEASPADTLRHIIEINTRARRDALRFAALSHGQPWFVSVGLKMVVTRLREEANFLMLPRFD